MVSPNLQKTSYKELTITENTKKLFQIIFKVQKKEDKKEVDDDTPKIKVSEVISKMAFFYEKIRNTVDYEEEYLIRKNAIERILKRQILIEGILKTASSEDIAEILLTELIRAGYLPNNKIPETQIPKVGVIIEKYIKLRNYSFQVLEKKKFNTNIIGEKTIKLIQDKNELSSWIIAMAATELEEFISDDKIKEVVISNMYDILSSNIKLPSNLEKYKNELNIQIYIGIYRNYLKFDQEMLSYISFKYFNSVWSKNPSEEDIEKIALNIVDIYKAINNQLNHEVNKQLNKIIKRYTVYFSIFVDVIKKNPVNVYESIRQNPDSLPKKIKDICAKKYKVIKSKLWRAAVRSIIYIFITKSIFVVILEIPAIKWLGEEVNMMSLIINIGFPILFLFLVTIFTGTPKSNNTQKIINGINEIIFKEHERTEAITLRKTVKRSKKRSFVFGFVYALMFIVSFGFVVWILDKMAFSWVSIIIFLFFLTLISFFSIRIRKGVRDLMVVEEKENILNIFIVIFYMPILTVGKWLSENFSRVNVFVFIMDFIIEAPFKVFVEITEQWTKYVQERKDEME